jgi:hypothetical protein
MKMEMTSARVHLGAQEHGTSASCHAKNTNMHDDRRLHTSFLSRPSVKDVSGVAGVMKARDQYATLVVLVYAPFQRLPSTHTSVSRTSYVLGHLCRA